MQCSYHHQPTAVCVHVGPDYLRPTFRLCEVCPQRRRQIKNYTPRSWMYQIQVWSTGGMILAGEHLSTRRKTSDSATSSTTNPTWNETGMNPGPHDELPTTNRLSFNMASSCCDLCVFVNVDGFQVTEYKQSNGPQPQ